MSPSIITSTGLVGAFLTWLSNTGIVAPFGFSTIITLSDPIVSLPLTLATSVEDVDMFTVSLF